VTNKLWTNFVTLFLQKQRTGLCFTAFVLTLPIEEYHFVTTHRHNNKRYAVGS